MSPTPHDFTGTEPVRWKGRLLVVAVADDPLRRWVLSELVEAWFGPIEILDEPQDILTMFGLHHRNPVLLICGDSLSLLEEDNGRSWERLSRRLTVVLVESQQNMELVRRHFPHVDAVLLRELHLGMAVGIVEAAKSGVRGFPPELVEQLLGAPAGAGAPVHSGNGAALPLPFPPAPARRIERADGVPPGLQLRRDIPGLRQGDGERRDTSAPRFLKRVLTRLRRAWSRLAGRRK